MQLRLNLLNRVAWSGVAVGGCFTVLGALRSSDLLVVCAYAAGVFFPLGWGIGQILALTMLRQVKLHRKLLCGVCAVVAFGSLIYGAVEVGFGADASRLASGFISFGLAAVTLSAAALPIMNAGADAIPPR